MELRHLRYFVAVAEQGNVSRAARKLFIAQPPLSAQLKQLEEEVGAALFTRLPRGVRLTPAGESLLEDARAILARAQQAPLRARERQQSRQGVVRLGLVPSAMHSVLPGLLRRIADAGWNLRVEAREMITSQQLRALRAGELDLGFGRPARASPWPRKWPAWTIPTAWPWRHPIRWRLAKARYRCNLLRMSPSWALHATRTPTTSTAPWPCAWMRASPLPYATRPASSSTCSPWWPAAWAWPSSPRPLPRCTGASWCSGRCSNRATRAGWRCWPWPGRLTAKAMQDAWRRLPRWS